MHSRKKHNISFIKPDEPDFIKRFKAQAGYVEGPSVDTKREQLPQIEDDDCEDRDDEKPMVVIMNDGDLTAEEADLYARAKKAVDSVPEKADLSQRVIFKRKNKSEMGTSSEEFPFKRKTKDSKIPKKNEKIALSFNEDDEQ